MNVTTDHVVMVELAKICLEVTDVNAPLDILEDIVRPASVFGCLKLMLKGHITFAQPSVINWSKCKSTC